MLCYINISLLLVEKIWRINIKVVFSWYSLENFHIMMNSGKKMLVACPECIKAQTLESYGPGS